AASSTNGHDVDLNVANMQLVSGHPCRLGQVQTAHLVYETTDGRPVSVYVCAKAGKEPEGAETISTPDGPVQIASVRGTLVAVSDVGAIRRIIVGDGMTRGEIVAAL